MWRDMIEMSKDGKASKYARYAFYCTSFPIYWNEAVKLGVSFTPYQL